MQHTTKTKNGPDLLSWAFVAAALLFMLVSIPATLEMTSLTHSTELAIAMVAVLEVLAFGAKLGTRWTPSWERTLDIITKVLLTVTTLANFGAGWDFLAAQPLKGFWAGVRDFEVAGVYPGAVAIVAVLSALVPFGIYVFLSLFVKRQRELETIHTPEAAAERALQPVILELRKQQRFAQELQNVAGFLPTAVAYPRVAEPQLVSGYGVSPTAETVRLEPAQAQCFGCLEPMTNAQKGVAVKWGARRGVKDVLCEDCRNQHPLK